MSDCVLWIHDEMLCPSWMEEGQPALFVFDEEWIAEERLSLKRLVFMAECLEAMPGVEVYKGSVVSLLKDFANQHQKSRILTARSPLPRIKRQGAELGVEWIDPEPIVTLPDDVDLKRFSRYWRKAEKQVLSSR